MARQLKATVYLQDDDGVVRGFGPGDIVPDWVAEQITNPDVWDDDETASDESIDNIVTDEEPPRTGKGSGIAAWRSYAEALGLALPEDATRDEIIAAVDVT